MSSLWVKCPQCGMLLSFIPQGGAFEITIKCLQCGAIMCHEEKRSSYPTAKDFQRKIHELQGKIPVQEECFS